MSDAKTELTELFRTMQKHEALTASFSGNPFFTLEHFLNSIATVTSRCFHINITKTHGLSLLTDKTDAVGKRIFFMVPFADLFNHHNSFPAFQSGYTVNEKLQALEFIADQDYSRGQQVVTEADSDS